MSNQLPLIFKVGNGGTIVTPKFDNGTLYIKITRNSTNMSFVNGQTLSKEEYLKFKEQVEQIPDAIFEFTDIELGIQFYSGFFKTPNLDAIKYIRTQASNWQMAICC